MSFLKKVFGNLVALIVAAVLHVIVLLLIVGMIAASIQSADQPLGDRTALVLDLSVPLSDAPARVTPGEAVEAALAGQSVSRLHLKGVLDALEDALEDPKISSLVIVGSTFVADGYSLASAREIRAMIGRFKAAGKHVSAYAAAPSQLDYYLMSAANTLYLNPYGLLPVYGLGGERMYWTGALEKLGIELQIERVGKYKSAVETYTRTDMSAEDRQQRLELYQAMWADWKAAIAKDRGLDEAVFDRLARENPLVKPEQALSLKLVDELAYFDGALEGMKRHAAWDLEKATLRQVTVADYFQRSLPAIEIDPPKGRHRVAVVYVEGGIVDGEGSSGEAGGDRLSREIRRLREDNDVRALVLRVNSPGGSAFASEVILQEVRQFRRTGRPVIVSMGGVAASGGYFVASEADYIFAQPETITGSIGIFGMLPQVKEGAGKLGLTFDEVGTHPFANALTLSRPLDAEERRIFREFIQDGYANFIERVARGRNLTTEQVEEIAQGRVWIGRAAKDRKLVDELGGLSDAIAYAVRSAKADSDYLLQEVPAARRPKLDFERLLDESRADLAPSGTANPASTLRRALERELKVLRSFNDPRHTYMRMTETHDLW